MRSLFKTTLFVTLIFSFCIAKAQLTYSISGIVKDKSGETLPSATIFLDGSEKKTGTNDKGEYILSGLPPGTYQLTVHFIGYKSSKQNVIIHDQSTIVNVTLEPTATTLKEVVITNSVSKNKYMLLFLENFIGDTENGRSCEILNPEILKFSEESIYVTAKTKDFLEIENKNLGYKIKYLLKEFRINRASLTANYTGECIFESLQGSQEDMETWKANRRNAYHGSLMHFFRSLYSNTTEKEGFFFYSIKNISRETQQIDTKRLSSENISLKADSNFLDIKFMGPLYLVYENSSDPNKVAHSDEVMINKAMIDKKGSIIELFLKNATVDAKGSLVDYRSFLVKGYWGTKRIGDQLPFEYVPDAAQETRK